MNTICKAAMRAWEASPARYKTEFAVWLEYQKLAGAYWGA